MQKPKLLWVVALAICVAIIVALSDPKVDAAPSVFNVPTDADLDRTINADLATTATIFQLPANTTYTIDQMIVLKAGNSIRGAEGTKVWWGLLPIRTLLHKSSVTAYSPSSSICAVQILK